MRHLTLDEIENVGGSLGNMHGPNLTREQQQRVDAIFLGAIGGAVAGAPRGGLVGIVFGAIGGAIAASGGG